MTSYRVVKVRSERGAVGCVGGRRHGSIVQFGGGWGDENQSVLARKPFDVFRREAPITP